MATSTGKEAVGTRRDSLEPLIRPASIAVIGASSVPSKAGHQLLRALDGFAEAGPEGAELQARAAAGGRATGAATAAGGARMVGPLDEDQAKGVLEATGLAGPRRRVCGSREEAGAAAAELGADRRRPERRSCIGAAPGSPTLTRGGDGAHRGYVTGVLRLTSSLRPSRAPRLGRTGISAPVQCLYAELVVSPGDTARRPGERYVAGWTRSCSSTRRGNGISC